MVSPRLDNLFLNRRPAKEQTTENFSVCLCQFGWIIDRAERHDFWSRFLVFILLFFVPLFLRGKRKGEKNNQSRGQKPCLSTRSSFWMNQNTVIFSFAKFYLFVHYLRKIQGGGGKVSSYLIRKYQKIFCYT